MITGSKECKAEVLAALRKEQRRNAKQEKPNNELDRTLRNIITHMSSGGAIEITTTPKKIRLD